MLVKVILVDVNPNMVLAWRGTFEENPEVEVIQGSMLDQKVSAWVSPTNSRGSMDGGLDGIIKNCLGAPIEKRVQAQIAQRHHGVLPVGFATCVPTGVTMPAFLISTPTMVASSEDISDSLNVALACAAAFQAVHMQNAAAPGSIESVALPGLGANTGKVPVEICADLMWTGYDLFRERAFTDFKEMRKALEERLGDLGPMTTPVPKKLGITQSLMPNKPLMPPVSSNGSAHPGKSAPSNKDEDVDFDDAEDFDDDED